MDENIYIIEKIILLYKSFDTNKVVQLKNSSELINSMYLLREIDEKIAHVENTNIRGLYKINFYFLLYDHETMKRILSNLSITQNEEMANRILYGIFLVETLKLRHLKMAFLAATIKKNRNLQKIIIKKFIECFDFIDDIVDRECIRIVMNDNIYYVHEKTYDFIELLKRFLLQKYKKS